MFRFTIRDVLLLTVIIGLAMGWYLDHRQARRSLSSAYDAQEHFKGRYVELWETLDDQQRAASSERIRNLKRISAAK